MEREAKQFALVIDCAFGLLEIPSAEGTGGCALSERRPVLAGKNRTGCLWLWKCALDGLVTSVRV